MAIPNWTGTAQIWSNAEHGLYSVQLGQIQQNFSCSGSCATPTTYTVSGYMLASGSSSAVEVTVVGNTTVGAYQYAPAGQIFYNYSASTWVPFSYSFTTPSNLTGGLFVTLTSVITGPVYLDNITVAVQNGPNLISNGDFELGATPNGWWGGASYCGSNVHSGECAVQISGTSPTNAISQTVYGLSPSTSYNVGVWYNLEAGCALNLSAGGTFVQTTTSGSWQFLYGTWTSSSSGTLAISISVSTNGYAYLDDVTISGGPANPTVTQSEAFGFDGFGNLLSQTPTAGTGPMMSLTADHNSNRLTGQGNYDGGGNFLGNSQYSYDILNRLSATGTSSYTYSPGDNKRMAVYSSSGTSAQAAFHIYDPNGRKIGVYTYTATAPWSRAQFQAGLSKDIWYLGSKRVDMSEDQVGSNWDQTQYYPWGQVQAGQQPSETQGFGTYVLDGGSGLYYADQRYYNPAWGRFLTPDPSNADISFANPTTWNRYAYSNGDPINQNDPSGLDPQNYSGVQDGSCPNAESSCDSSEASQPQDSGAVFSVTVDLPSADPNAQNTWDTFITNTSNVVTAIQNNPFAQIGASAVFIVSGFLSGNEGEVDEGASTLEEGVTGSAAAVESAVNGIPDVLARAIPNGILTTTLGPPGAADVFVTTPAAIQGLNSAQIAQVLTLEESPTGFQIFQFPTPAGGLASPVFRTNPGFVGGGYTAGGAPEFVIPNGPIPPGATITIVP